MQTIHKAVRLDKFTKKVNVHIEEDQEKRPWALFH